MFGRSPKNKLKNQMRRSLAQHFCKNFHSKKPSVFSFLKKNWGKKLQLNSKTISQKKVSNKFNHDANKNAK